MKQLFMALLIFSGGLFASEKLYVYYPSPLRPNVVQNMISEHVGDVEVIVFGKYRDFIMKVQSDSPKGVLTMAGTIAELGGAYAPKLNAVRGNSDSEEYVILSTDNPLAVNEISAQTVIGVVDFMGRGAMRSFVEEIIGVSPRVQHVTKIEDLLPLLSFNMAQGVLIPADKVDFFKSTSNLDFAVTPLPKRIPIAQLALTGDSAKVKEAARIIVSVAPDFIGGVEWR